MTDRELVDQFIQLLDSGWSLNMAAKKLGLVWQDWKHVVLGDEAGKAATLRYEDRMMRKKHCIGSDKHLGVRHG